MGEQVLVQVITLLYRINHHYYSLIYHNTRHGHYYKLAQIEPSQCWRGS